MEWKYEEHKDFAIFPILLIFSLFWFPYCFINYSNFLIANSSYSPLENPSGFFKFTPNWRLKMLHFHGSEQLPNPQVLGVIPTKWHCAFDVDLLRIKKTTEQKLTYFDSLIFNDISENASYYKFLNELSTRNTYLTESLVRVQVTTLLKCGAPSRTFS